MSSKKNTRSRSDRPHRELTCRGVYIAALVHVQQKQSTHTVPSHTAPCLLSRQREKQHHSFLFSARSRSFSSSVGGATGPIRCGQHMISVWPIHRTGTRPAAEYPASPPIPHRCPHQRRTRDRSDISSQHTQPKLRRAAFCSPHR